MERKKKLCKGPCGEMKYLHSKGKCLSCDKLANPDKYRLKQSTSRIKPQTAKNKVYRTSQSAIRNEFFEYHLERCQFSEEDGSVIPKPSRTNICHLWYKRIYKSVQAHPDNYVYLQAHQHTRFDYLLDCNDFSALEKEFKCWPLVVERMKNLLPEITEGGKFKELFVKHVSQSQQNQDLFI